MLLFLGSRVEVALAQVPCLLFWDLLSRTGPAQPSNQLWLLTPSHLAATQAEAFCYEFLLPRSFTQMCPNRIFFFCNQTEFLSWAPIFPGDGDLTLIQGVSSSSFCPWGCIFVQRQSGVGMEVNHTTSKGEWSGSGPWSSSVQSDVVWDEYCPPSSLDYSVFAHWYPLVLLWVKWEERSYKIFKAYGIGRNKFTRYGICKYAYFWQIYPLPQSAFGVKFLKRVLCENEILICLHKK